MPPTRRKRKRGRKVSARDLKALEKGPEVDYIPPAIAARPRRPGDRDFSPLTDEAQEKRDEYWQRVAELVELHARLEAEDRLPKLTDEAWIIQFKKLQTCK